MSFAGLLPVYVQAVAILFTGVWAYWRFFHQRSDEPATDIDVDVRFVGTQGNNQIVEVIATLENKSLVRHSYEDFRVTLRYLLGQDSVIDGDNRINHQLYFPHTIDRRIEGAKRYFANVAYINPRQRFQHRYETFVPSDATFILVHCKFAFKKTRAFRLRRLFSRNSSPVFMDTQKIFSIPDASH